MPLPAAALFDMDGLLVETESIWFRAETEIVDELGGWWGEELSESVLGGPIERAVRCMIEHAGGEHDELVVRQMLMSRMGDLLRTEPIHWQPGARTLLLALQGAGVPMALVSASWRPVVDAVMVAALDDLGRDIFVTTVAGDDLPRTKPHPDPYLEAARRLGVGVRECVVLEDSPTGAQAGVASGAYVVAVPSLVPVPAAPGLRVVQSLSELTPELLGAWSQAWHAGTDARITR
ncbi:MAG: HAD family phosphatase [Candidatus Nanopelagicales bacterium]